jgi:glucokinase
MILGGDLGGTKTLLALAERRDDGLRIIFERRYSSHNYPIFDALLGEFLAEFLANRLADAPVIKAACFGVAGHTDGRNAKLTYLPWQLSAPVLEARVPIQSVILANDFAAAASGLRLVAPEQLQTLQAGKGQAEAPRVILGAGTGLGVAGMIWDGNHYRVIPGEGGHLGFSPQTPEQGELWRWLLAQGGRVTAEDVISGPGLARIYAFMGGEPRRPEEVGNAALNTDDPLARQAVELWLSAFGAFAGDLAQQWLALGGVYLAGGIAAKLMPHFGNTIFLEAFNAKREHRHLVETMPVHLVTEERLGLLGALALADDQADQAGAN